MQDHKHDAKAAQGDLPSAATQDTTDAQLPSAEAKEAEAAISQLKQILEGAILAAHKPLSIDRLMDLFDEDTQPSRALVKAALEAIRDDCEGRGFELKQVASGYRFQVRQGYAKWIGRLWDEKPPKYSRAFLETLALIAYKQPITRGDIEEIRGVTVSTNIIRSLLEREWVRILGHRQVPGRPALYGTTREFLDYFDLSSLDQLPSLAEIKEPEEVNEALELSEAALIPPGTRPLEYTDHGAGGAGNAEETSLEQVTARVNQTQENIKHLFRQDDGLDSEPDTEDQHSQPEPG